MNHSIQSPDFAAESRFLIERLLAGADPVGSGGMYDPSVSRPVEAASGPSPERAARDVVAAIGFELSEGPVLSPQGESGGMFSRRLAHIRIDLSVTLDGDHPAAVIAHEASHCVDPGAYDFDHPWEKTPDQVRNAVLAQLVAGLSSHGFVRAILGADPGPGQLALARHMVEVLRSSPALGTFDAADAARVGSRVADVVRTLDEARTAPSWRRRPDRQVAVDRGRGVMWLAVGPAAAPRASLASPPSRPATRALALSREAQARFRDDPRFTDDLDRSRPVPGDEHDD
ncbi:hypothetical protein OG455_28115 [Kitasatospora sp. NBC_01287]|uniref:hypothetical protein n=1 Tax=Kitasatospora sp. NBC_01287 TaxID=2903573 RepID=UPI00225B36C2|nr:hypothetical protein [Kitasatospora sp. NBC_01287]MCX4749327.1 hypothetical protein [Kitasatospora sp. NBC_01287]